MLAISECVEPVCVPRVAMTKEEFAARLREIREAKGLSREELADRVGVSEEAIALWERAQREPSMGNFVAVARALGVSLDAFLEPAKNPIESRKPGRPSRKGRQGKPTETPDEGVSDERGPTEA